MSTRLNLRLLAVCTAALAAVFLPSQFVMAKDDVAIAPKIYGWWTQTNIGGIGSVQPDVQERGMLVENDPAGPISLSALQFSLKDGVEAKRLGLSISGNAFMTQPPVACMATTAFESAEGGAWEDGPAYDCERSVPGVVNNEKTQVRFAVGRLAKRRSLSVVILAGGPTDRVVFAKPGRETLSLKVKAPSTLPSPPAPTKSEPKEPVPVSDEGDACCAAGVGTPPELRDQRDPPVSERGPVAAISSPAAQPDALPAALDEVGQGGSTRRVLGTTMGVTLLLLCILYWSDGFGALGLRSALAARLQERTDAFRAAEDRQASEGVSGELKGSGPASGQAG